MLVTCPSELWHICEQHCKLLILTPGLKAFYLFKQWILKLAEHYRTEESQRGWTPAGPVWPIIMLRTYRLRTTPRLGHFVQSVSFLPRLSLGPFRTCYHESFSFSGVCLQHSLAMNCRSSLPIALRKYIIVSFFFSQLPTSFNRCPLVRALSDLLKKAQHSSYQLLLRFRKPCPYPTQLCCLQTHD